MKNKPEGFNFTSNKQGDVSIAHHGKRAATLRGTAATKFLNFADSASVEALKHRRARLTGNYKHGNERQG